MIYSVKIENWFSLLGEVILREGFFDGGEAMPRKPKRPYRMTGCTNLTDRKSCYCEAHEKTMQQHYENFTRGYDQHERYVRSTLVHHIQPISEGGTHDESNLMSLCVSCHERIHQRKKLS